MAHTKQVCPHCDARIPANHDSRECPECGAILVKPVQSRFPRWHWRVLAGTSIAACLSILTVIFASMYYSKSNELAKVVDRPNTEVATSTQQPKQDAVLVPKVTPKAERKDESPQSKKSPTQAAPKSKEKLPEIKNEAIPAKVIFDKIKNDEVVFLKRAPSVQNLPVNINIGVFQREIIRQAFFLTAREEFGLLARDGTFGESIPNQSSAAQRFLIESRLSPGRSNSIQIEQGELGAKKPALNFEFSNAIREIEQLTRIAGDFSRNQFAEAFRGAGLAPRNTPFRAESTIAKEMEERLAVMSIVSQFAALRALNAEMRAQGESPELLGAIVRGYANLGVLTEHLWSPAHKVFKARSLLYAERLLNHMPGQPWGHWHRAYAQALAGLHAAALSDIESARNKKSVRPAPSWVQLIEQFCLFHDEKIAALGVKPELSKLARFLRFLAVEDPRLVRLSLSTAEAILEDVPECTRVLASITSIGYVGNKHRSTLEYLAVLSKKVPEQIAALPDLPESVAKLMRADADEPEIWQALSEAGDKDTNEPSWQTLSQILQEDRFVSIWRRVDFMRDSWAVPTEEFIEQVRPFIENHSRKNVILLYGLDRRRDAAAYTRLALAVPLDDIEFTHLGLWKTVTHIDPRRNEQVTDRAIRFSDATYRDYGFLVRHLLDKANRLAYARKMLEISPHGPAGICALMELDIAQTDETVAEYEKKEGHQPSVLSELGARYFRHGNMLAAERCWKAYLKRSPDSQGYKNLANIAKARGKMDEWKATLDEYLKVGEHDLDYARVQVDIARYLMGEKQWKEAQPYADEAAKTWAGWAMVCANQCHEGLGDWEKSEMWIQRLSDRYPAQAFEWIEWCLRVGKGDRAAAQQFAEDHIRKLADRATPEDLSKFADFYLMTGQKGEARDVLERLYKSIRTELLALYAASANDDLGQKERRNQIWNGVVGTSEFAKLAKLMRESIAKGESEGLDLKDVEQLFEGTGQNFKGSIYFFSGRFVERHGKAKEACEFYNRCVRSKGTFGAMVLLSKIRMRELGYEFKLTDDNDPK